MLLKWTSRGRCSHMINSRRQTFQHGTLSTKITLPLKRDFVPKYKQNLKGRVQCQHHVSEDLPMFSVETGSGGVRHEAQTALEMPKKPAPLQLHQQRTHRLPWFVITTSPSFPPAPVLLSPPSGWNVSTRFSLCSVWNTLVSDLYDDAVQVTCPVIVDVLQQ